MGALERQRRATLGLLSQLEDDLWDLPCLEPWRIRDVVAHLVCIDGAALSGRLLPLLRRARTREDIERWNDHAVERLGQESPSELIAALERSGARLVAVANRIPAIVWQVRLRTVFGRQRLSLLLARRVLDEWVHMVDIARSAKSGTPQPIPCPGLLASAVLDALPALMLPRLTPDSGVVRLVVSTAPRPGGGIQGLHRTWSVDFERRQFGPRVTRTPDATVALHSSALALLTEGRSADGYGPVLVTGDRALAAALLDGI